MKRTVGFYLNILAAILTAISVFFYTKSTLFEPRIAIMAGAVVLISLLMVIFSGGDKEKRFLNLTSTICAILLASMLILSLGPQLDPLGWWVSGLYTFEQVRGYIYFAGFAGTALLVDIIASFIDVRKEA